MTGRSREGVDDDEPIVWKKSPLDQYLLEVNNVDDNNNDKHHVETETHHIEKSDVYDAVSYEYSNTNNQQRLECREVCGVAKSFSPIKLLESYLVYQVAEKIGVNFNDLMVKHRLGHQLEHENQSDNNSIQSFVRRHLIRGVLMLLILWHLIPGFIRYPYTYLSPFDEMMLVVAPLTFFLLLPIIPVFAVTFQFEALIAALGRWQLVSADVVEWIRECQRAVASQTSHLQRLQEKRRSAAAAQTTELEINSSGLSSSSRELRLQEGEATLKNGLNLQEGEANLQDGLNLQDELNLAGVAENPGLPNNDNNGATLSLSTLVSELIRLEVQMNEAVQKLLKQPLSAGVDNNNNNNNLLNNVSGFTSSERRSSSTTAAAAQLIEARDLQRRCSALRQLLCQLCSILNSRLTFYKTYSQLNFSLTLKDYFQFHYFLFSLFFQLRSLAALFNESSQSILFSFIHECTTANQPWSSSLNQPSSFHPKSEAFKKLLPLIFASSST